MEIKALEETDFARWDAFVERCPEATFFHRAGWKTVIERAFGHRTHFLYAESQGAIVGVLPLGHIRSRLFGNALISTPFCVYGGIAAENEQAHFSLQEEACRIADRLRVDHLEMRNLEPAQDDWPGKDRYATFRKSIDPDSEVNLRAIPRKQRAMVRKGIKAGLHAEIDDGIDRLFEAYSRSVRNLGTPVFPRRYFAILKDVFGRDCEISVITHQGSLVAAVMSFYFRDQVLPYYGGGTQEARRFKGNDFMYWELMRRACEQGVRLYDFGRSKVGTGSYSFKKNWGFEPQPLHYRYYLVKARDVPDVSPMNPKYRMFINLWRHLPLGVSQTIGPLLARNLG